MQHTLYNPFTNYDFFTNNCFLSGEVGVADATMIPVFPTWILEEFKIADLPFKLLDESFTTYADLKVPCSLFVKNKIDLLQKEISAAFNAGPDALNALDDWKLFYWAGLIAYGLIYIEIQNGFKNQQKGEPFDLSPALIHKFKNLHFFLQGIYRPFDLLEVKPFSLFLWKVEDEHLAPFEHRNEINSMTFSLRIRQCAMIICLQDNAANSFYHQDTFARLEGKSIDAKQFQEINARIFYSSYLYNQIPEYDILEHDAKIYMSQGNLLLNKVPFDAWVNKTYAQVLEAFWKPWNLSLFDILKDPNQPLSFL